MDYEGDLFISLASISSYLKANVEGSRIYAIYTFAQADWTTQLKNYFLPKKFTIKYTEHGKNMNGKQ
ncbi:unnamed protein product [Acanthoscelides obtectus]|uniref:Uncharacterized protein n=1 Tax=Acanthoscelides obtectus TaxID=200917 RepID=A0A9P0LD05_ACAOB|nr:unnamed protein product [Acanthoscelides obtectus]CAK1641038.1 hypothetical protein AOBTE_LOCUS12102 [Acanthoscelides obtectus]